MTIRKMTRQCPARRAISQGLCLVVFTSIGLAAASTTAVTDADGEPFPAAVFSNSTALPVADAFSLADRYITISWRVRTHATGIALRLYRGDPLGNLVLLAEQAIEPGVRSFRQEDVFDGVAPFFYLLKVVEPSGRETELAGRWCRPQQLAPAHSAASAPPPNAALLTPSMTAFQLVMSGRPAQRRYPNRGLRPEPPTPPPRL